MIKYAFTLLAIFAPGILLAQKHSEIYYRSNPVWIQMMDDETTNYFEAVHAFELYWENKTKPTEENELFSASNEEKEKADFVKNKKNNITDPAFLYAFEYKKFINWQRKMKSFVLEDGTIMNAEQRLTQWRLQLENRK